MRALMAMATSACIFILSLYFLFFMVVKCSSVVVQRGTNALSHQVIATSSKPLDCNSAVVSYVNGVNNTRPEYKQSVALLRYAVDEIDTSRCVPQVSGVYNTIKRTRDEEKDKEECPEEGTIDGPLGVKTSGNDCLDYAGVWMQKRFEKTSRVDAFDFHSGHVPGKMFQTAVKEIRRAYDDDPTMKKLLNTIDKNTKQKRKTIIVAHSQGNLYAAASIGMRREKQPDMDDGMAVHIGVASPSAFLGNWRSAQEKTYVTLEEDQVIWTGAMGRALRYFPLLRGPLPANATIQHLDSQCPANAARGPLKLFFIELLAKTKIFANEDCRVCPDGNCHEFARVYIADRQVRRQLVAMITNESSAVHTATGLTVWPNNTQWWKSVFGI